MVIKIEKRKSYIFFEKEYEYYKKQNFTHEQIVIVLNRFFAEIDARGGFYSKRNADAACDSLDCVFKNKENM